MSMQIIKVSETMSAAKIIIEHGDEKVSNNRRVALLAIDRSGSMAGNAFIYAIAGACKFLEDNVDNFDEIYLLVYNDNVDSIIVTRANLAESLSKLRALCTGSCTDFTKLFTSMTFLINKLVEATSGKIDIYASVFSDGKHFVDLKHALNIGWNHRVTPEQQAQLAHAVVEDNNKLEMARTGLNTALSNPVLRNGGGRTWCVTRAFSRDVDVPMLEVLTHFGTESGDFQYAFTAAEIGSIITNDDRLTTHTLSGDITFDDTYHLEFQPLGDNKFEAITMITADDIVQLEVDGNVEDLIISGERVKVSATLLEDTPENAPVVFNALLTSFGMRMRDISQSLVRHSGDKAEIDSIVTTLRALDKQMSAAYDARYHTLKGRLVRKNYGSKYNELRRQMHEIIESAIHITRANANESLAKILHAGHSVGKSGLQKRLNKLTLAGAAKLEQMDAKLIAIGAEQKADEITARLSGADFRCMISLSDVLEAVLDQDVMCITGNMTRPPAAVADSSRICFNEIHSNENCIVWSVFEDELLSQLNNLDYSAAAEVVHGGFNVSARVSARVASKGHRGPVHPGVMQSAYRGNINFAFPLYINGDHWEVVRHMIPKICAWMSTLDFAAQTFEQVKMVPFVLVLQSVNNLLVDPTHANIQAFMNVSRVVRAIAAEYNMKHIHEDYQRWITSYAGRVPKAIANLSVFMIKLAFMRNADLPELDTAFWLSIYEEAHRRTLVRNDEIDDQFVADQSNFRDFVVTNDLSDTDPVIFARLIDSNAVAESKDAYVAPVFSPNTLVVDTPDITELLDNTQATSQNLLTHINNMRQFYNFMRSIDRDALYQSFDDNLGIVTDDIIAVFQPLVAPAEEAKLTIVLHGFFGLTNVQTYGMIIQNKVHKDNRAREECALAPVADRDPTPLLIQLTVSAIQSEQTRRNQASSKGYFAQLVDLFCTTNDNNVAAGIIKSECMNVGSPIFHMLLKALQELRHIPNRESRIRMIVNGKYDEHELYRPGFVYPANKRNRNRLIYASNWQRNRESETPYDDAFWACIFKWTSNHAY